jgi:transcriptional regulator with XRE-family HTH domain
MATFSERLKELRKEARLTQDELAKVFFLNKSSISRYEKNKQIPEMETLQKIAGYFNVSIDYLLGNHDLKNYNEQPSVKPDSQPSTTNDSLTPKDKKEISDYLEDVKKNLETSEGLMFDGNPATPEAIQSIIDAMEMGMAIAKKRNKEKYTPNKYKDTDE